MKARAFSDGLLLGMARWDWRWWGNCGVVFWGVVGAGNGVDAGCEPTGTSALPGGALPVAVRLGRCFWGWRCWGGGVVGLGGGGAIVGAFFGGWLVLAVGLMRGWSRRGRRRSQGWRCRWRCGWGGVSWGGAAGGGPAIGIEWETQFDPVGIARPIRLSGPSATRRMGMGRTRAEAQRRR